MVPEASLDISRRQFLAAGGLTVAAACFAPSYLMADHRNRACSGSLRLGYHWRGRSLMTVSRHNSHPDGTSE
jgi:hypothetical protein